jgi:hypothetical protein
MSVQGVQDYWAPVMGHAVFNQGPEQSRPITGHGIKQCYKWLEHFTLL